MFYASNHWVLVDRIDASAQSTLTFSSSGNGVRQYSVNGNNDGGYMLKWSVVCSTSANNFVIELNGATTNQTNRGCTSSTASGTGESSTDFGRLYSISTTAANQVAEGMMILPQSSSANTRIGFNHAAHVVTQDRCTFAQVFYNDSSTNITSIVIARSTGAGTLTGTFWLYCRNPQAVM